jgi:hypothetical protein
MYIYYFSCSAQHLGQQKSSLEREEINKCRREEDQKSGVVG